MPCRSHWPKLRTSRKKTIFNSLAVSSDLTCILKLKLHERFAILQNKTNARAFWFFLGFPWPFAWPQFWRHRNEFSVRVLQKAVQGSVTFSPIFSSWNPRGHWDAGLAVKRVRRNKRNIGANSSLGFPNQFTIVLKSPFVGSQSPLSSSSRDPSRVSHVWRRSVGLVVVVLTCVVFASVFGQSLLF